MRFSKKAYFDESSNSDFLVNTFMLIKKSSLQVFFLSAGALVGTLFLGGALFAQSLMKSPERVQRDKREEQGVLEQGSLPFLGFLPTSFEKIQAEKEITGVVGAHFASFREQHVQIFGLGDSVWPVNLRSQLQGSQGFNPPENENLWSTGALSYRPNDWFFAAGRIHAGGQLNNRDAWYHLEQAYSELRFRKIVFSIGRKPLYWGQSFVAPLLLSDHATSFNSIQLATLPQRWPWIFKYLGNMRTEIFLSRMNSERVNPNDYFLGWRLGLLPLDFFETNIALIYQFGGKGIESGGPWTDTLLEILGGRGSKSDVGTDSSNITNRAVQMDYRFSFKNLAWPLSYYSEQHLDDCCGEFRKMLVHSYSYMHGFLLVTGRNREANKFRMEYARTGTKAYFHPVWHSGFSNNGRILGHPLGPDGEGAYFRWNREFFRQHDFETAIFWEKRNRKENFDMRDVRDYNPNFQKPEQKLGFTPRLTTHFSKTLKMEWALNFARVWNKASFDHHTVWDWGGLAGLEKSF
jgi:hypothetical protein